MSNAITPYSSASRRKIALSGKTGSLALGNANVPAARVARSGNLVTSNTEPLIGNNGEFNGHTKKEMLHAGAALQRYVQDGTVQVKQSQLPLEVRAARTRALEEAIADAQINGTNSRAWHALGEVIGDEIFQSLG